LSVCVQVYFYDSNCCTGEFLKRLRQCVPKAFLHYMLLQPAVPRGLQPIAAQPAAPGGLQPIAAQPAAPGGLQPIAAQQQQQLLQQDWLQQQWQQSQQQQMQYYLHQQYQWIKLGLNP
jgi:hypothetical protein